MTSLNVSYVCIKWSSLRIPEIETITEALEFSLNIFYRH